MSTKSKVLIAAGVVMPEVLAFLASMYRATPQQCAVTIDHPTLGKSMFEPHGYDAVKLCSAQAHPNSR